MITGKAFDELLNELYQARRWGQNVILILAGRDSSEDVIRRRAKSFGISVFSIATESDLKIWMQGSKHA